MNAGDSPPSTRAGRIDKKSIRATTPVPVRSSCVPSFFLPSYTGLVQAQVRSWRLPSHIYRVLFPFWVPAHLHNLLLLFQPFLEKYIQTEMVA